MARLLGSARVRSPASRSSGMTGSISWTPTSGFRRSLPPRSRARAAGACLRRVRAPLPARLPGHLDPPLRLVHRLVDRPADRPSICQVRRQPGRRAGPCVDGPVRRLEQRHRGRRLQGTGFVAAQARELRATGGPAPRPAAAVAPPLADPGIPGQRAPADAGRPHAT